MMQQLYMEYLKLFIIFFNLFHNSGLTIIDIASRVFLVTKDDSDVPYLF